MTNSLPTGFNVGGAFPVNHAVPVAAVRTLVPGLRAIGSCTPGRGFLG